MKGARLTEVAMTDICEEMMAASRKIAASLPPPRFYASCSKDLGRSRAIFAENGLVLRCRETVLRDLPDNLGHGQNHAEKVALEAGALALMEGTRILQEDSSTIELGALAQMAGLLHDVCRGEKDHARRGAEVAKRILSDFPIPSESRQHVVEAIANHEAFVEPRKIESVVGQMISDVLYDADKFRWGPDNFTVTLWEMLRFSKVSIGAVINRFPEGMSGIARIKGTFRSQTAKVYGPEFIELGLEIGEKIYGLLVERFGGPRTFE